LLHQINHLKIKKMAAKTTWAIDPTHSEIAFKVKHLMITNVKGSFTEFNGQLLTDGDDFTTAEISFTINPASINTGVADRDAHLKSADFFDVEKFKEITFTDGKLVKTDENEFNLFGNLVIKGVSQPVTLQAEYGGQMADPWGNVKAGFTLEGKINRKDFGLTWNATLETGGVLVSDEIRLNLEIQLLKQQA
jgi:polyisoprenoid-binding protein YceI